MIRARGLTKSFEIRRGRASVTTTAVDGIDLDVAKGEVVGFLGPNGAGKSTTLRMLTTLLRPTSGTVEIDGQDIAAHPREVRRRIGYVSQNGSAGSSARVGDEIADHAMLYGLDASTARSRGQKLLEQFDLAGAWGRQVRTLSGGQRRRLDITLGLVHQPSLLFLDEPTTGLDPQARANLWQHISLLRDRGMTVFLTTHYLDEADTLSDRIVVIDHGRIIADDTPTTLKDQVSGDMVELELATPEDAVVAARIAAAIGAEGHLVGNRYSWRMPLAARYIPSLVRDLDDAGVGLIGIDVRPPSLDDVFLTLTGRSLRENP